MQVYATFSLILLVVITRIGSGSPTDSPVRGAFNSYDENNQDLKPGELPSAVQIISLEENKIVCGGVLVTPNVVVTNAHCLASDLKDVQEANYEVIMGSCIHKWGAYFKISRIFIHPSFSSSLSKVDTDVAFIVLKRAPTLSIKPIGEEGSINLPELSELNFTQLDPEKRKRFTLGAFGDLQLSLSSPVMQKIQLKPSQKCRYEKEGLVFCLDIVGGSTRATGAPCFGNCGSGIYTIENNKLKLVGIHSSGLPVGADCRNFKQILGYNFKLLQSPAYELQSLKESGGNLDSFLNYTSPGWK